MENCNHESNQSRRKFIQQSDVLSAGVMLAGTSQLFATENEKETISKNITSRGYAAKDTSGKLTPWEYSGICPSDIHQMKDDWE